MRLPNVGSTHRRRESASAVLIMIVLLGLMLLYVGANLKTLHFMSRELKLIEKRQIQRLQATNRVASALQPQRVHAGETSKTEAGQ